MTIIAAATAIGDATRTRREYVIAITERAVRAERTRESEASRRVAEDRLRIARDLHDVVAHQIAVINLHAGVASAALPDRPESAEQSLQTVRQAARSVLAEIGDLLAMLRTTTAEADAADHQVFATLAQLDPLVRQFADVGLSVQRHVLGDLTDLPPAVDVVGYRVVQEALTNAHKHGAGGAELTITRDVDQLVIEVANRHGAAGTATGSGHGLDGIRERVASVRRLATIDRGDLHHQFEVRVRLPLGPQTMSRS